MNVKRTEDLEQLFGDARLEPRSAFTYRLAKELERRNAPRKRVWFSNRIVFVGSAFVLVLALVVVPLLRPESASKSISKPLARTILLKDLYATAMADALPKQPGITFWDVMQTDSEGPAAASCNANIGSSSSHSLFFKKDNVTAALTADSYDNTGMYYSDDADVPAFNTGALTAQNGQFDWALDNGTLTDVNGNPLPGNSVAALKNSGIYEIYATYPTLAKPDGTLLASCPKRLLDLKIDAVTGMFTEADEYNGSIAPANLADKTQRTIKTATGDFASVEPQFNALGFNLEQAKANAANNPAQELNQTAGYEFLYRKADLGKAELTEEKNSDGSIGVYAYHFAKQPGIKYRLYTAKAKNQTPKDLADLKDMGAAKGWQVLEDSKQLGISYTDYPHVSSETYVAADGTTMYGMFATGTPDIPYVYIEVPSSASRAVFQLLQVTPFTPGSQPPAGL